MNARLAVYFDLETGGIEEHRPVIQIAACAVDQATWSEVEAFECKIAFDQGKAEPQALAVNHWTAEAWADSVQPAVAVSRFSEFLNRHRSLSMMSKAGRPYTVAKLIGHNAATFDGPRLQRLFKTHGTFLPADPRVRCTVQRAMWHFDETGEAPPDNFKLSTLCRHFGIEVAETHEALADVRLTIQLARALAEAGARRAA